jgi:hypothetical protein
MYMDAPCACYQHYPLEHMTGGATLYYEYKTSKDWGWDGGVGTNGGLPCRPFLYEIKMPREIRGKRRMVGTP